MSNNLLDKNLTVTVGGEKRNLLMQYGLLDELLGIARTIEHVPLLAVDREQRYRVLNCVLAERSPEGVIIKQVEMFTLDIAAEDVHAIFAWVGAHVLDFFLTEVESTLKVHLPNEPRLKMMTTATSAFSLNGSPN